MTSYGAWPSPLSIDAVLAGAVGVGEVRVDRGDVWWSEIRPQEDGRTAIVHQLAGGTTVEALGPGVSARTRVHEYGGGGWWVDEGTLFYVEHVSQRIFRSDPGSEPVAITPVPDSRAGDRYADGVVTPDRNWVICVRERHGAVGQPRNEVVAVPAFGEFEPIVLVSGPDFVSSPAVSPDGSYLCWVEWDHPSMPWDATRLRVAELGIQPGPVAREISCGAGEVVAGGGGESVMQPRWVDDDTLLFIGDSSGFWNLYRRSLGSGEVQAVTEVAADLAGPQWVFGQSWYDVCDDGSIVVVVHAEGAQALGRVDGTEVVQLETGLTAWSQVRAVSGGAMPSDRARSSVVGVGASFTRSPTVVQAVVNGDAAGNVLAIRPPNELAVGDAWLSVPEHLEVPSADGYTFALYYPPTRGDGQVDAGAAEARPPLLVLSHGGPTAAARSQLSLDVQFWTTRGFAVVDVNYRGSSGYGRSYRDALQGEWGLADVEDCVTVAQFLVDRGDVDAARLAIRGGSAGGYTTLQALAHTDVFSAGVSRYGVADLVALAKDTHKFEARYLDGLVGPWPDAAAVYRERSPINHVDGFSCPMLVLQGLDDVIVPPDQSQMIVDALRSKGVRVAYLTFEGEAHGFRQAATLRRALDAELAFYSEVFGFTLQMGSATSIYAEHLLVSLRDDEGMAHLLR